MPIRETPVYYQAFSIFYWCFNISPAPGPHNLITTYLQSQGDVTPNQRIEADNSR